MADVVLLTESRLANSESDRPRSPLNIGQILVMQLICKKITLASPSFRGNPIPVEGFAHGSALPDDFKLWLCRHPGLSIDEALHRYRDEQKAKQRRKGLKL